MCDILVSLPDASATKRVIFGKNSDRPAGECQILCDSADDAEGHRPAIQCAFVEVPRARALRTIGCRPYWCWGYETGMNEAGVVGGNTAVFTRSFWLPDNRVQYGLTGMELLRLGLERGDNAGAVVSVIVDFLEQYGQWAPAVLGKGPPHGCYENAFLVADKHEAWIVETSGKRWVARRFTSGTHALSNELTTRDRWTQGSDDLADHATTNAWWRPDNGPFDFALAYSDHEHYPRQVSHIRWTRAKQLLAEKSGRIDVAAMMEILRDHYEDTFLQGPQFSQYLPDFLTLCMHDSPAGFTWGNTATSVAVEIDPESPTASPFWCAYQPPCSSVYLPFTMDGGIPQSVSSPGTAGLFSQSPVTAPKDTYRKESLWWRMYRMVAAVSKSPVERRERIRSFFDRIEKRGLARTASPTLVTPAGNSTTTRRLSEDQLIEVNEVLDRLEREWKVETE